MTARVSDAFKKTVTREYGLPEPLVDLLVRRGFTELAAVKTFLEPRLADLPSPFDMAGMDQGVALILEAVAMRQPVVVHGDYDVDGITSTALLIDFLGKLDLDVIYHLPNRMKEGYGVSEDSVEKLAQKVAMPALFITVDCGISAHLEVQKARELGFKVIVTDHHEPGETHPPADAVINPKQDGCGFSFKSLAGVGVVFFLAMALRRKMVEAGFWTRENAPNLKTYLDLVALGTVADVVELESINRILVKAGLEVVNARNRPGLWALCEQAKLNQGTVISSEDIAYRLAPRINAAGRLGFPEVAVELLQCSEMNRCQQLARQLEEFNLSRRDLEKQALDKALEQADEQINNNIQGLVLKGDSWHPGVVGIIASRIVDRFHCPVLVFTRDTLDRDIYKGSGRSVPGVNLFEILTQCRDLTIQHGGHAMAAGVAVHKEKIDDFRMLFDDCVKQAMVGTMKVGTCVPDIILTGRENGTSLAHGLQRLEPFGQGNPEPIFLVQGTRLENIATLREHLKFTVALNGARVPGIGFFMADHREQVRSSVDLTMKLKLTRFRGRERVEAHAVAITESTL